jgi:hypothetical protein
MLAPQVHAAAISDILDTTSTNVINTLARSANSNTPGSDGCVRVHAMLVDRRQSDNTFQMAVQFYSSHGYLAKLVAGTDPNSQGSGYWAGSFYDTANIEWGVDLYTTGEHGDYRSQRSGFQTVQLMQVDHKTTIDNHCQCNGWNAQGGCNRYETCRYYESVLWDAQTCQNLGYAAPVLCGGKDYCDPQSGTYGNPVWGNMAYTQNTAGNVEGKYCWKRVMVVART